MELLTGKAWEKKDGLQDSDPLGPWGNRLASEISEAYLALLAPSCHLPSRTGCPGEFSWTMKGCVHP